MFNFIKIKEMHCLKHIVNLFEYNKIHELIFTKIFKNIYKKLLIINFELHYLLINMQKGFNS